MNTLLRSTWAAALCVAAVSAQAPDAAAALARAQLLENQEADLSAAEQAYRALLADGNAAAAHGEAALRLGTLLWRLDRKDDGKPFLERAAAAGGTIAEQATAVLQGQGEQGKQAQERLDKARALVALYQELTERPRDDKGAWDEATSRRRTEVSKDLRWLGSQAAQAIVDALRKLDDVRKNNSSLWGPGKEASRKGLSYWLWQIGTNPAVEALREWAQASDVLLRRAIAEGTNRSKVAADLEPALLEFVRDPDPAGEVWRSVVDSVTKLTNAQHLQLASDPQPSLAAAGLAALAETWPDLTQADREQVVVKLGQTIRRATQADDARLAQAAWRAMKAFAALGPRSAQSLFLAEAHRYPGELGGFIFNLMPDVDDAFLSELRAAAKRVGKQMYKNARGDDAGFAIAEFVTRGKAKWTAAGVDDALTLLELGYGTCKGYDSRWLLPCLPLATADQLARLIRALPDVADPELLIRGIGAMRLPAEVFPALRDLVEVCLSEASPPWSKDRNPQSRSVRGRGVEVSGISDRVVGLCGAIANTRAPAVAAWFGNIIDREAGLAAVVANLLVTMSGNGVGASTHEALRKLLVWPGTDENELQPHERSQIFAELARVGDVAAIPLFPRTYELGLQRVQISRGDGFQAAGIGFLGERKDYGTRRATGPWHGYGDPDLITAWRTLVESTAAGQVWDELNSGNVSQPGTATSVQGGQSRAFGIPLAVLPVLCQHLPKRWALAPTDEARRDLQNGVLMDFHRIPTAAVEGDSELARALRMLLKAEDTQLAMSVFASLPSEVGLVFADEARLALRRSPSKYQISYLLRAGIELPVDDWRDLLQSQERNGLVEILKALPPQPAAALRAEVEATLAHGQPEVRIAACQAMRRTYAADAVPSLLPLLQDPSDDVRKAARANLDQLREEHERRTFWVDAKSGIDLSPASAAAKLLAQAKPGEAKDQRLLAIRSLAVLAAAESLPYLIEWTKDTDADVATAARTAIAQIHQKAGTPEPSKK